MLVITRAPNEAFLIYPAAQPGQPEPDPIRVLILRTTTEGGARIGIEADKAVKILREEIVGKYTTQEAGQ
jgi:sRNA-binding carbon storage regulator CsrA